MENEILTEENYNEIVKARRDKLKTLCENGKDPFEKVRYDFNAYSQDVTQNFKITTAKR